jgi:hypothetical protein
METVVCQDPYNKQMHGIRLALSSLSVSSCRARSFRSVDSPEELNSTLSAGRAAL